MANPERWRRFEDLPADVRDRLGELPALLEARSVHLAYVFGSIAEDGEEAGDVDLAILTGDEPAYPLRSDIEEALGTRRLDLVDLRRASPRLRFHVIRDGRLIYARDDDTLNRFELDTLHRYRDTALFRRRHREALRERMDAWS